MFMATEQNFWSDWSKQAAKVCEKLDKSYWQHLIDQSRKTDLVMIHQASLL